MAADDDAHKEGLWQLLGVLPWAFWAPQAAVLLCTAGRWKGKLRGLALGRSCLHGPPRAMARVMPPNASGGRSTAGSS